LPLPKTFPKSATPKQGAEIPAKMSITIARDRCYDFLNIFAEKFGKNIGVFSTNYSQFCKKNIITLVFEKKTAIFCRKLAKIAENCDHNIDPTTSELQTTTPAV
jgi:hypothetical protein